MKNLFFLFQRRVTNDIAIIGLKLPDGLSEEERASRIEDFVRENSSSGYVYLGTCEQVHGEKLDASILMDKARAAFRPEEPYGGYFLAAFYPVI